MSGKTESKATKEGSFNVSEYQVKVYVKVTSL
jgi:hypothetical protein